MMNICHAVASPSVKLFSLGALSSSLTTSVAGASPHGGQLKHRHHGPHPQQATTLAADHGGGLHRWLAHGSYRG
jgi:hypothetical protein